MTLVIWALPDIVVEFRMGRSVMNSRIFSCRATVTLLQTASLVAVLISTSLANAEVQAKPRMPIVKARWNMWEFTQVWEGTEVVVVKDKEKFHRCGASPLGSVGATPDRATGSARAGRTVELFR
jgi:hypothetical protein